ncbi:DUF1189 family protein [Candidatus Woesearchaeota archaeon]|nr:DUF1189 family protein [Candidatus Woesearchaeota archaeon]
MKKLNLKNNLLFLILKRVYNSANPAEFEKLTHKSIAKAFKHTLFILFVCFIIMSILALPKIISISSDIQNKFSHFDKLTLSIEAEMNSPLIFTEKNPQIIIDTNNQLNMSKEKLIITKEHIYYKPYNTLKKINTSEFKNLLENKEKASNLLTFLIILALPSILITSYLLYAIKYLFIAIVFTLIGFIIARLKINPIKFKQILKVSLYSTTSMILIEVISVPFSTTYLFPFAQLMGMNFYISTMLLYLITFIAAFWFESKKA